VGDKVMLSTQNLSLSNVKSGGARKLAYKWIGPYRIVQVISPVTYKLDSSKNGKSKKYLPIGSDMV
jgi:hypothetical protein